VQRVSFYLSAVLLACMLVLYSTTVYASEIEMLLRILLNKGIITESEYKEIKTEIESNKIAKETDKQNKESKEIGLALSKNVSLSGSIYGEYRWMKHRDITDSEADSTSDLYLRKIELGTLASLTDWAEASVVLNSEWIGDDINQGDEKVTVDEATLTLKDEDFPLYLVVGKRTQPFGVFENHLITDPLTQDAYETKKPGVTVGVEAPMGLDVSLTVYKGEEQMNHLFESGLFEDTLLRAGDKASDDVSSFILSVSVTPIKDNLTIFGSYLSEPGWGRRNETVNGGFSFAPSFFEGFRLDAEYMKALKREEYAGANKQYREAVISVTAAYEFILRKRQGIGGGLFAERRAHLISEPLEVALRYEYFDDDGLSDDLKIWSVKDRYSVGARYSFYNDETSGLNAFVAGEYRRTELRTHTAMKDSDDEFYIRVGVDF